MDAFYLEMRISNDPETNKHAEDYNLMVMEMVKGCHTKQQPIHEQEQYLY